MSVGSRARRLLGIMRRRWLFSVPFNRHRRESSSKSGSDYEFRVCSYSSQMRVFRSLWERYSGSQPNASNPHANSSTGLARARIPTGRGETRQDVQQSR